MMASDLIPILKSYFDFVEIAQIPENRGTVGIPSQSNPTDNSVGQIGTAAVGGAVVVTALFKLFEKYGTNVIDGQKSRRSLDLRAKELELELEKAEKLAARKEEERKTELIEQILNNALLHVYSTAKENKEIYHELLEKFQKSNEINEKAWSKIEEQSQEIHLLSQTLRDVLGALSLKDGQNKA